jgi:Predicted dehydrogenases and related proteins
MRRMKVGVIGCGNISPIYLQAGRVFETIEIVACADIDMERARSRAAEFGVPKVLTPDELLADPEVEIVLNLTVPKAHAEINLKAIEAGKHVYTEKPLATNREGYRARIRNHGHSCFLCEIVIRSQFHTTYEPEA